MRVLIISSLATLLLAACQNHTSDKRMVSVVGQAKMKVVPDMVELSLQAYNVRPAMRDAVAETQNNVNEIMAVCKRYVVDPSDIKISSISTNKSYDYSNGKDKFVGYEAAQMLNVTLKNITKIQQFTEELLATKISKIENVRYNHTKADSIMREVNLMALEDARKTAEKMCNKMNTGVGDIIYLSNYEQNAMSTGRGVHNGGADYDMHLYSKSFGGSGFKMTTQILEFSDVAYANFRLK